MNTAMQICQARYDAMLPPDVSDDGPERDWLEQSATYLVSGMDITWKRRYGQKRTVTFDTFCTYLQGHLNQRQIDGLDERDSFARLLLSSISGCESEARGHAQALLGESRPVEAVEKIAMDLLRQYAKDGAAAEREAAEDDVDGDL
ncbi:hypothetical protein M1B34_31810 [Pseudomonas sp. MAFF 302030]|uniref:Uncharacterized protein n=1 Tax=Pseudomonas morbosilactucae TaxID=2938197 RepID=A0A9X1Z388_9PSED|nr:hypothetical protein [Pseudomonas morbosilactucae]MCK9802124.1 hypothetical protein [Pseudomonas morbosilactucae]